MLWPLGGVAYVDPPLRPGAMVWSIAAGPLVNVALMPIFYAAIRMGRMLEWKQTLPDAYMLLVSLFWINLGLLVFNILPVYPLDGGKILWSLLWYPLGRAKSLMVSVVIGMVGIVGFFAIAAVTRSGWGMLIAVYMLVSCWGGLQHARELLRREKMPRREGFACPSCKVAPPVGPLWSCVNCEQPFDTFASRGVCPNCGAQYSTTMCGECKRQFSMNEWTVPSMASFGVVNGGLPTR